MSKLASLPFNVLWKNYPDDPPCINPNGDVPNGWSNQCAVRIGTALERSGVSFSSLPAGGRCPTGPQGGGMVGNAERLAGWLKTKQRFANCGTCEILSPPTWETAVSSRTGIIFFRNYWRRNGERSGNGTGDHIDLWNRDRMTSAVLSFMRFTLGIRTFPNLNPFTRSESNANWYSDLNGSSAVWFWHVP